MPEWVFTLGLLLVMVTPGEMVDSWRIRCSRGLEKDDPLQSTPSMVTSEFSANVDGLAAVVEAQEVKEHKRSNPLSPTSGWRWAHVGCTSGLPEIASWLLLTTQAPTALKE